MIRLYRALLYAYPASFRLEYGEEMCAVFARRAAATTGMIGPLGLVFSAVLDVMPNAMAVHWDVFRQDLRYSARGLRRSWGFALTAVLVVALGVGANTAAFSLADFVLIRPLPFPRPEQLVKLNGQDDVSPALFRDWTQMTHAFVSMGAYSPMSANVVGQGEPQRIDGARVTADLMPTLGARPLIGRTFTVADDQPGTTPSIVLGYGVWQSDFGGDAGVVGRTVNLDGIQHVILGVMPSTFNFPTRQARFWKPFQFEPSNYDDRDDNWLYVIGRLRDRVTLTQARGDLALVQTQLARQYPHEGERRLPTAYLLRDEISGQARLLLQTLCGAALCILLLACANLANLLLARAVGREREMSVRAALGAGRERLMRQMVTDSALLALIGGAVGVVVATATIPPLARLVPSTLPLPSEPSVDPRMLLFAALLTGLTGIGFGVIPALRAGRASAAAGLREGPRGGGGRKQRARFVLVAVEVMASVVLLISSGLLVRAMWRLQATDPGFRADGVLTLRTQLPLPKYETVARREEYYRRVLTDVRGLPGVTSAAYVTGLPMVMRGGIWGVAIPGQPEVHDGSNGTSLRFATPQFFSTMGIPLRHGRDIEDADTKDRPAVAVVSESFVRRFWPNEDPIGKHFTFASAAGIYDGLVGPGSDRTVVGVVGNVRVRGFERSSEPQVYLPSKQVGDSSIIGYIPKDLVIRSPVPEANLIPAVRRIVHAADAEQPISGVRTLNEIVADETASRLAQLRVLGALATIALLLAIVGIHGLLSFTVSRRAQEFGVRLALGARPGGIVRMILREGALMAVAGVLPGLAIAYAAGRGMQSLLAGVRPTDPLTMAVALAACVAMAIIGSLMPALRAVKVDPASVMRGE